MDHLGAMSARGASGWKQTPVTKQHDGNNAIALEKKPPHPGSIEPEPNSGRTLKVVDANQLLYGASPMTLLFYLNN